MAKTFYTFGGKIGVITITNTPHYIYHNGFNINYIYGGIKQTLSLDNNGKVWGWGYNNNGQLGDNTAASRRTPVSILGANKTFCKIYGGTYGSIGLDKNGRVWGWGYNFYGQVGDNSTTNRCTPVSILGANKTFCFITTGWYHSFGIDKNGRAWGWGYGAFGQLGNNTEVSQRTPVSILGANKTFCSITLGKYQSLVLDKNGKVWGWGRNHFGQLGDNSVTNRCTPVSILGANKTFCKISVKHYNSLGLDKNGRIWGWGYNATGQLGNNSVASQRTPVSILGANKTFCSIATGQNHSMGLDKNGRVWCWGSNAYGELGDNTLTARCTPVSILGDNKTFCTISAGYYHSLGIDKDGKAWGWGYNVYGSLGDNTVVSKKTPVRVLLYY